MDRRPPDRRRCCSALVVACTRLAFASDARFRHPGDCWECSTESFASDHRSNAPWFGPRTNRAHATKWFRIRNLVRSTRAAPLDPGGLALGEALERHTGALARRRRPAINPIRAPSHLLGEVPRIWDGLVSIEQYEIDCKTPGRGATGSGSGPRVIFMPDKRYDPAAIMSEAYQAERRAR